MNKIILILFIILIPSQAKAFGWDSKAFNESLERFKGNTQDFIKEPKKSLKQIENNVKSSFEEFSKEAKTQVGNGKEVITIYKNTANKINQYRNINNPQQFLNIISSDLIFGINYVQYNGHNTPIIGPYVSEIKKKIYEINANATINKLYIYRISN